MKLFLVLFAVIGMVRAMHAQSSPGTVVLLHGMGRTSISMSRLASALKREGYTVINASYASRTQTLESLATEWLPAKIKAVDQTRPVHFVTHSMGGIIVRLWVREKGIPPNLGRVVMLAPPNRGSEVTDQLQSFPPYRWVTGVNGLRLGTESDALPRALGPWPVSETTAGRGELGIIAGSYRANPLIGSTLPRPNDGKVSVAATHLSGERDHLTLPYSHTWMGWRQETIRQVSVFLRTAQFSRDGQARTSAEKSASPTDGVTRRRSNSAVTH